MLDNLRSDLRFCWRGLGRSKLFTSLTLLTLTLGIGANSAIFSVVDSVLLKPLPYPEPDRIVAIWNHYQEKTQATLAGPEFYAYKQSSSSFEAMAAFATGQVNLTGGDSPLRVSAVSASDEIFRVLGISARIGRTYAPAEDRPGTAGVVLVSHELWQRSFGSSPDLVGTPIQLDGSPFEVIGILEPGARLPSDYQTGVRTDIWVPLGIDPANPGSWGQHGLQALARIKTDVSLARAEADLDRAVANIKQELPSRRDAISLPDFGADLWPIHDLVVGPAKNALLVLMGAVLGVLLVTCANVANMLLARTEKRQREISVRNALGASRSRLFRQFLTESLLLTGVGGLLGIGFCYLAVGFLQAWNPGNIPRIDEIHVNSSVLLFTLGVVVAASLLFGIAPSLQISSGPGGAGLKTSTRFSGSRLTTRLRSALVVAQMALAIVLVSGAILFLRSFWNLQQEDLGFEESQVLTFDLELDAANFPDQTRVSQFVRSLRTQLGRLPGIESVGAASGLPLSGRGGDWNFYYEGKPLPEAAGSPKADWQVVTPGYFESLRVPLVEGRTFQEADDPEGNLVVIVNQALSEQYWPGESPIGQRVRMGGNDDNPFITIVGIVGDIRYRSVTARPSPQIYLPLDQAGQALGIGTRRSLSVALRSPLPEETLAGPVRETLRQLSPALPMSDFQTLENLRARSLGSSRFAAALLAGFAALALLLGTVGIYGVVSYLVARRSREMGLRMALGALPGGIVRMILRQGLGMVLMALPPGLFLALACGRLISNLLYQVSPFETSVFAAVTGILTLAALLACYLPARQASKLDPARILQAD